MYSLLIVDDELLVRNHLRTLIDWEQYGFTIEGEASNGREALHYLARQPADVVISDIRMPVMDGVELSREMQLHYPHIPLVMLSNYDDYAYVRGTLQYGAIDYLLKHLLGPSLLLELLPRLQAQLKNSGQRGERTEYRVTASQIQALKQRIIVQLLARYFKHEAEIATHLRAQQLPLETTNLVPIVIELDQFRESTTRRGLKEEELLQFSILNIIEEVLSDNENGVAAHISGGRFIVLLSYASMRSLTMMDHRTRAVVNRIDQCIKMFTKLKASFSIGSCCEQILQIPESYEQCCLKLTEKFYRGANCMIYPEMQSEALQDKMTGIDLKLERELQAGLRLGDEQGISATLTAIFSSIRQERLSPVASQMIFNELLGMVNRICRDKQLEADRVYLNNAPPHEAMASHETLDDIQSWLEGIFTRLVRLMQEEAEDPVSPHIRKASLFMKQHLHDNLSLSDVADQVGISAPYLSSLFKDERGIGFSEYLMDLRLDKAKALLREEKLEFKEVAVACGFNNYPYFFNVFKKKVGMTPGAYVRLNKS